MKQRGVLPQIGLSLSILVDVLSFHSDTAFLGVVGFGGQNSALYFTLLLAARILTHMAIAWATGRSKARLKALHHRVLIALGTLLALLGIALILAFSASSLIALLVLGAFLFGGAQGLLGILWLTRLVLLDYRGSYLFILIGHVIATLLCALLLLGPLAWLPFILTACLLVSSIVLYLLPQREGVETPAFSQMSFLLPRLGSGLLTVSFFALISGFMLRVSATIAAQDDPLFLEYIVLGSSLLVLAIMLMPALVFKRPLELEASYRVALPLSALGFLILPSFIDILPSYASGTLVTSGYMVTGIVLYCSIAEVTRTAKVGPLAVYACTEVLTLGLFLAGDLLGGVLTPIVQNFDWGLTLVGVGFLYLLVLCASWLFTRHSYDSPAKNSVQRPLPNAPQKPLPLQTPPADSLELAPAASKEVSSKEQEFEQVATPALPALNALDETTLPEELNEQERVICAQLIEGRTLSRIAEDLYLSTSSVKYYTQKIYRAFGVHSRNELLLAAGGGQEEATLHLAQTYGLSTRETEVLAHLIAGRTIGDIATELSISENTARTHIKRIYSKLDVHSKQDIIDKVREG